VQSKSQHDRRNLKPASPSLGAAPSVPRGAPSAMARLRLLAVWACVAIAAWDPVAAASHGHGHHRQGTIRAAEDSHAAEEYDGGGAAHLRVLCSRTRGSWCWRYHKQPEQGGRKQAYVASAEKQCQNDCSGVGNCNFLLGKCDCPAGAQGTLLVATAGPPALSSAAAWTLVLLHRPAGVNCTTARDLYNPAGSPPAPRAGFRGEDCSVPDPRPCTNRHAGEGEDHPVSHMDENGRDRNVSAEGWTASRCGGEQPVLARPPGRRAAGAAQLLEPARRPSPATVPLPQACVTRSSARAGAMGTRTASRSARQMRRTAAGRTSSARGRSSTLTSPRRCAAGWLGPRPCCFGEAPVSSSPLLPVVRPCRTGTARSGRGAPCAGITCLGRRAGATAASRIQRGRLSGPRPPARWNVRMRGCLATSPALLR
jgi:hypothetical protein